MAAIAYRYLIEKSVVSLRETAPVSMEVKGDHIVWGFETVQLRQGVLPAWIKSPQWYHVKGVSNLYFEYTAEGIKISRLENLINEWTPTKEPANT